MLKYTAVLVLCWANHILAQNNTDTSSCTCVPYYLCVNGTVNTNGEGVIDLRMGSGSCNNFLEVCCKLGDIVETPQTPTPSTTKKVGCGYRNSDGTGINIIMDENEAQFGEFSWMVAVLAKENVGNSKNLTMYLCGGALIHPSVVLTAAHCLTSKTNLIIRAGEWDSQTPNEIYAHEDRDVENIVVHPNFTAGPLFNDVALLFLKSPVPIAEHINVVCLPPQDSQIDDSNCFASGWGKNFFGKEGRYQNILKRLELPTVPKDACQKSLRTTRLGKYFQLHESFICAGGKENVDTCTGDGGSPLVCPIAGKHDYYQQVGIVAWGIGCKDKIPGVYVNVALFRKWIDDQMALKGFESDTYSY